MRDIEIDNIKIVLFDIDGVITDGKKYLSNNLMIYKGYQMKDFDAVGMLKSKGYLVGCISGENESLKALFEKLKLDYVKLGCKKKEIALIDVKEKYRINFDNICYIGDGNYDIPILEQVGLAICPNDAIEEVKKISDIILKCRGGEGCLAETYTRLIGS